jgi:antitoxin Phd
MAFSDKGRVLLIDPDPSILRSYSRRLARAGFEVEEATKASDALRHIENDGFDVLFSDFKMPDLDGLALMRKVRNRSARLQVVLILDNPSNEVVVQAAELGVLECLVKPITLELLEKTAVLALRRSRRAMPQAERPIAGKTSSFTASEAKNEFARMLEKAMQGDVVVITKHDVPKAVLISVHEFNLLSQAPESKIETLTAEFDSLLAQMQGPAARKGMEAAFHASPKQLGTAAVAAARKRV